MDPSELDFGGFRGALSNTCWPYSDNSISFLTTPGACRNAVPDARSLSLFFLRSSFFFIMYSFPLLLYLSLLILYYVFFIPHILSVGFLFFLGASREEKRTSRHSAHIRMCVCVCHTTHDTRHTTHDTRHTTTRTLQATRYTHTTQ